MSDAAAPAEFDRRTTDREEIVSWIEAHGGQPMALQDPDADEVDVTFGELDRAIGTAIGWDRFFERFDEQGLAFAYDEAPAAPADAYALVDRTRIEASNRLGDDDDAPAPDPADDAEAPADAETDPTVAGDGRSTERHEAATDAENADNHRDEPPFDS